ncbi:hypothetical protein RRG08_036017 [Elysia crispata]|uniref:Uncharacterized protein n=1 Tax=Elysia crispata TaxID=231223 RepID=A0AAE1AKR3_9GAST|nr:hypothetical protein RRG08_036017 [Elysia crispata]
MTSGSECVQLSGDVSNKPLYISGPVALGRDNLSCAMSQRPTGRLSDRAENHLVSLSPPDIPQPTLVPGGNASHKSLGELSCFDMSYDGVGPPSRYRQTNMSASVWYYFDSQKFKLKNNEQFNELS